MKSAKCKICFVLKSGWASTGFPLPEICAGVQGWVNHVRYGNTIGLRKAVLGQAVVKKVRE